MAAGSRLNRCLVELTQECQDLLEENKRLDKEVQELSAKLCAPRESRKEILEADLLEIDHPFAPEAASKTKGPRVSFDHIVCAKPAWDDNNSKSLSPMKADAPRERPDPSDLDDGPPEVETLSGLRIGMLKSPTIFPGETAQWSMPELLQMIRGECCAGPGRGSMIQRFADGLFFKTICVVAIGANTVYIGAVADTHLRNSYNRMIGLSYYEAPIYPDVLFAVWFSLELMVRILAERIWFFTGDDKWWNMFDVFLVLFSIVELSAPNFANLSLLRVFRVFRLVRVVRVVRTVKALRSLRTMLFAMLNSFTALLWAFVLIGIVMFVFSVIFDMAIASSYDLLDPSNPDHTDKVARINTYFPNLFDTMVALFCSITGGNDWMLYADLLRTIDLGEVYFVLFAFYVGLSLVGVLNVVTGIFVDSAVCTRTEDEVVESWTEDQKRTADEVRRIFKEADRDMSGSMTYKELEKHLQNPWVKAYFSGMDIDASEAAIIFTLMDSDRDNEVTIDEFVDGTMKLKGHAKSIDILSVMYDNAKFQAKFSIFCSHFEDQLVDMKNLITPGAGDKMERMYRPASQQVDYVKCFNKLRTSELGQTTEPSTDDLRCDPILPTHHG